MTCPCRFQQLSRSVRTVKAELERWTLDAVADYDERSLHGGLPALSDLDEATKSVLDAVAGFRPLQRYLDDVTIEGIWV